MLLRPTWQTLAIVLSLVGSVAAVPAADAPLAPGDPPVGITHQEFSGVGGTNTSGGALNAFNAFEAAIGGVKNVAALPQTGGFRTITWDGVALDGTDFGGNTTIIVPNKVVGIPVNRFQTQGTIFEEVYAVSSDGFTSVNPSVNAANPALFPSFSPTNTFAMFNTTTIDLRLALPSGANTTAVPAATRGFGAVFQNVRLANTTSIEYFDGDHSLGQFFVPVGTQGQSEFLGELFSAPVVTRVTITCGTDVLFSFDGTTPVAGAADNPGASHNLVVTDDFVYAEPVAVTPVAQTPFTAVAGVPFSRVVGVFNDSDAGATINDYTATIDWGDGLTSPGSFAADSAGGFQVEGAHTYQFGGTFRLAIEIQDFLGSTLTLRNAAFVVGTPKAIIVTGADKGGEPEVRVLDAAREEVLFDFTAFEVSYKGGVHVAAGDVNGDGIPDIIVARGPGGPPEVKVFDGKDGTPFPAPLGDFLAYDPKFKGGVWVAAGDVNGDGKADIVTAPGPGAAQKSDAVVKGAAPQVEVFDGATGARLLSFFGEDPKFKKGLSVAAGDVNGDGKVDIITGAGPGGPPFVNLFDGSTGQPLPFPLGSSTNAFPAFDLKFKGGIFVAADDLNGDGKADIIVGAGPGGIGPHVRVFDGATGNQTSDFLAYAAGFKGGVRVGVGDVNGDGKADIITSLGKGSGGLVEAVDGRTRTFLDLFFTPNSARGSVFVAGSR